MSFASGRRPAHRADPTAPDPELEGKGLDAGPEEWTKGSLDKIAMAHYILTLTGHRKKKSSIKENTMKG